MTGPKQPIEMSAKQSTHIFTCKTIKKAYLKTAAIPKHSRPSQHHHRESPEVHGVERTANNIGTEKPYVVLLVLYATGVIRCKLHGSMKLLDLLPALCRSILVQKAVILNICHIVRKFLTKNLTRSAWSVRRVFF
jgi:hypothetical protein